MLNQKAIIPNTAALIKKSILNDHKKYGLHNVILENYETTDLKSWLDDQRIPCEQGCENGICVGENPCIGVTCNNAPAPYCVDGVTLRTYPSAGACDEGFCEYEPTDVTCPGGCDGGPHIL